MRWYNKSNFNKFMQEVKNSPRVTFGDDSLEYIPLVIKISNKINTDESRVGVFGRDDIVQSGNVGLVEAWYKVDWDVIGEAEEPMKRLANYLSARVDGAIKRSLNKNAVGVAIPESAIRRLKAEQMADKLFGNWMYSFRVDDYAPGTTLRFVDVVEYDPSDLTSHYTNVLLNERLSDVLLDLPQRDRDVVKMLFGIDFDRRFKEEEVAKHIGKNVRTVRRTKKKVLEILNNEENRKYFEDFL